MTSVIIWPSKSPTEVDDRGIDWTKRLNAGEYILSSTWSNTVGITVQSQGLYGQDTTVVWLSGGVLGKTYRFVNRIATSQGRLLEMPASILVEAR